MNASTLPVGWFDLVTIGVLGFGFYRGMKRGMSEELLDVFQWLTIVVVSAMIYKPLGAFVANYTKMAPLIWYIASYAACALLIKLVFTGLKRAVGEKLVESDVFGRVEFILGAFGGAIRYGCMLLMAASLLNAKYISPEQVAAQRAMQQENFGTISFPTLGTIQEDVFVISPSGRFIRSYLNEQLIDSTAYTGIDPKKTPAKKRERLVNEVMGGRGKK